MLKNLIPFDCWLSRHKSNVISHLISSITQILGRFFSRWISGHVCYSVPKFTACSSWELCPKNFVKGFHGLTSDIVVGQNPPDLQNVSMKTPKKRPSGNIWQPILYSIDVTLLVGEQVVLPSSTEEMYHEKYQKGSTLKKNHQWLLGCLIQDWSLHHCNKTVAEKQRFNAEIEKRCCFRTPQTLSCWCGWLQCQWNLIWRGATG